jgi:AraC family transcriptional regulator
MSSRGFAAEYVQLSSAEGFTYSVTGKHHYSAIHDILIDDGEIFLDGTRAEQSRDLRRAITTRLPCVRVVETIASREFVHGTLVRS